MLVDRDEELARFDHLCGAVASGGGATVVVEGVAGIGKTALLMSVLARTAGRLEPLTARGGELEHELAFSIVRQLFEAPLSRRPVAELRVLFAEAAGLAAPVFGGLGTITGSPSPAPYGPSESNMGSVVHGLYWLCANLATRKPLRLIVDDVHWAD
ncbi:MAG TPA: AAA family ATPase, partial [Kineosporiaceae bacterium]